LHFFTFNTSVLEKNFYNSNDDLLVKYLLGEVSAAERTAVETWLEEDGQHQQYYNQLQQVWAASKNPGTMPEVDENAAWQRFQQRVATSTAAKRSRFTWLRAAASILLLVGVAGVIYLVASR
jgi:transmembrane sensor